jgi:hypothetical protein
MRSYWGSAAAALLIAGHFTLGYWAVRSNSATYDEPMHVSVSYSGWKTKDYRLISDQPALATALLTLPLHWREFNLPLETKEWREAFFVAFSERFVYWSGNDANSLIETPRLVNLALSCLCALLLWYFLTASFGAFPGLIGLAFYAFSPAILANATLATTDFPATAFAILAVLSMSRYLESPNRPSFALGAGAAAACALLSKNTAVLLWPAFALALIARRDEWRIFSSSARNIFLWGFLPFMAIMVLASFTGFFFRAGFTAQALQAAAVGHPSFLMGRYSSHGWWWFYLAAFALKSTLPEIAVLVGGIFIVLRGGRAKNCVLPMAVIAAYAVVASISHKQIGLRYILPVYPMLAILAAATAQDLSSRFPNRGKLLAVALAAAHALSAAATAPHFLAYFNEPAGGPEQGYRYLVDSSLDWGQDLKRLGRYVREEGGPEIILSYFGTASAEYHGVLAQQLLSTNAIQRRHKNSDRPKKELLVVSATQLQGPYLTPERRLTWLKDRKPLARVGYTLFVYDVTQDAGVHRRLAAVYGSLGDSLLAEHELTRARIIEGSGL